MTGERGIRFEQALRELEEILAALEAEELRLDEALELFERGVGHLRAVNRLLDEARGRVEELVEDAAGELRTVPFELPSEADEGKEGDEDDPAAG